jgi:4-amino-4-deoxy-L-arabinose transferase-like glycosyltransferase
MRAVGRVLRRIPRAAWTCALVAALNAVCWSIVTPPFQVPDEPDHFAYVKQLAETGELPSSSSEALSLEELAVLQGLRHSQVAEQPEHHTIATTQERGELKRYLALAASEGARGSPAAGLAASQPPLYYALEAIPYELARGGSPLDRLQLMRFLSALMAGATALFVFMFLREALPASRPAWTVGALAVALVPLLGFMSGAVNPDSLLFAVSAAAFYCLARAFRRGLSTGGAIAIGAVMAVGLLTKLNFLGLVPGICLGAAVLAVRVRRSSGRSLVRLLALTLGIGLGPAVVYALVNAVSNHPLFGLASTATHTLHGSPLAEIDYIWQLYLPRLPGMVDDFPGLFTPTQLWFHGYVGLFGWFDVTFPSWVYTAALAPAGALALLCARSLLGHRAALRARASELAVYAVIALGLLVLIGADSYHEFPTLSASYAQARYLLPLLALLGAAAALAARGAGRRWAPVAGALIVLLFLAHDVFSLLLTAGRYYS